jgi:signal transduction histidine kinase/CheY-like chemotaxis protein
MTHVERELLAAGDLGHLREDALGNVLLFAAVGLYCWCATLFPSNPGFQAVWRGPLVMAAGLVLAAVSRKRRPSLAAALLLLSMAVADLHTIWLLGMGVAPYLLSVTVALTGLLFDFRAVLAATVACGGLMLGTGLLRWQIPLYSAELLAPMLVVGAVGITSALSVRNLYLALYWAWDRAVAAQRNEKELRERRAELARTAKALDEACQRLEHMNYDLAQARAAADEARLVKQQFTTNVSHELRTPLNVIIALSEMMYLSPESYGGVALPPEYLGDVREIYRSSQHLLRLIDDVLDLSQIEARRMTIHLEPASLADVASEALDIMRPLMRGKEVELRAELPAELPTMVMDRARVRQVLINLLNNARRFTQRGSITVRAAADANEARVTVADTGIGIAPADHDRVFEAFRQLDGSTTRKRDGTGLGLAISKRFVEMHGGRIWVESEGVPGEGSQFHFTLPLEGKGMVAALERTKVNLKRPTGRGRTLLVLGQDPATIRLLEQGLDDYQLVAAADISEAMQLAGELQPRAVVLNPAQSRQAWQQARLLGERLGSAALPVILCPLVGDRELGRALGVVEYLVKPISRAALASLLDHLGEGVRRILILDDDPRMAQVLSRLLHSTGRLCEVSRAYRGQVALREMRRERPDLVLLDLVMPEMDGQAVLARMQEDADLRSIPVAVITALEHTPEEERRLGGGVVQVRAGAGFSNEEALAYLRHILEATVTPTIRAGANS